MQRIVILTICLCFASLLQAQRQQSKAESGIFERFFDDVEFRIDTSSFSLSGNKIRFRDADYLAFRYLRDESVAEIILQSKAGQSIKGLHLMPSGDYTIIDSLFALGGDTYVGKIRFKNITRSDFLSLKLRFKESNFEEFRIAEIKLFPFTPTTVEFYPNSDELFIGEEKVFDLVVSNPTNIVADGVWTKDKNIDYMLSRVGDKIKLHVLPNQIGNMNLEVRLRTIKPVLDAVNRPVFELPKIIYPFQVRVSRIAFLNLDRREVLFDNEAREGITVQIDYNRNLSMQRTYRIESQEDPGGRLIAELFTKSLLTNNRVLCILRIYNLHRISDGYLYLKENDKAKFITNFNIIPQTSIQKISLLRDGADYTENLNVFPGETVEIKIEGTSLDRANFSFEDLFDVRKDSVNRSENVATYKIRIPSSVSKRRLIIYSNAKPTGFTLSVREYQRARPLDFLDVSYGDRPDEQHILINTITAPILYRKSINDIIITPLPEKIDSESRFYGRQHLKMKVTVTNSRRELLEMRNVDNIIICPGHNSPRSAFYDKKNCQNTVISINGILSRKTNDLPDWAKVEIEISHDADRHGGEAYVERFEIILERRTNFDIDVSFPAGLVSIRPDRPVGEQLGSFGGVSLAAIAQFSFYRKGRIAQFQPYRIGIGTIALNAFDFSANNNNRGLAIVSLASLSPTRRDVKLRLTLYAGGGYLLSNNELNPSGWFWLLGPGVVVRL
ncbi:MAG: hypothetical protein ACK4GL_06340 [Flavobacteriales bacterium]